MKRILTIQDISCFGKCSLTVALPVISAMGVEAAVIPTAVLSTHTGGFTGFTFRDLTDDINDIAEHWKSIDLKFDGIYTGYLGSKEQINIVSDFFDTFKNENTKIIVDPVLGDNGKFYTGFDTDFAAEMRKLCSKADVIVPNMTEVSYLLDIPYTEKYDEAFIKEKLIQLTSLGCKIAVITGVMYDNENHGAVAYDSTTGQFCSSFCKHIDTNVHGTGDIFSSVLSGSLMLTDNLQDALDTAVHFTHDCINATLPIIREHYYGAAFELCVDKLTEYTKKLK